MCAEDGERIGAVAFILSHIPEVPGDPSAQSCVCTDEAKLKMSALCGTWQCWSSAWWVLLSTSGVEGDALLSTPLHSTDWAGSEGSCCPSGVPAMWGHSPRLLSAPLSTWMGGQVDGWL